MRKPSEWVIWIRAASRSVTGLSFFNSHAFAIRVPGAQPPRYAQEGRFADIMPIDRREWRSLSCSGAGPRPSSSDVDGAFSALAPAKGHR